MVAHARADHPDEACGVVAGPVGSDRPERFIPMVNAARSPTFYEFDSDGPCCASTARWTTTTRCRWSSTTRTRRRRPTLAHRRLLRLREPEAHYVPVSTARRANQDGPYELRSYCIVDGEIMRGGPGR